MISTETRRLFQELTRASSFLNALHEVVEEQVTAAVNEARASVKRGDLNGAAIAEGRAECWESLKHTFTAVAS